MVYTCRNSAFEGKQTVLIAVGLAYVQKCRGAYNSII